MKNEVEEIRKDILEFFDESKILPAEKLEVYSPDKKYFYKGNVYKQTDPTRNWEVTKIEIYQTKDNKKLFEFIRNESFVCHCWLSKNGTDYFICPEDYEGQSIYDLTNNKFYSFTSQKDPFIWTEIFASPDKTKLAVVGCFWACPYEIVIYDIREIYSLPYPVIERKIVETEQLRGWKDNQTILLERENEEIIYQIKSI